MERFTVKLPDDLGVVPKRGHGWPEIAAKLAAYEDTGLTPGQVSALQTHPDHAYADYVRTLWHNIGGMERMEAVAKAERENRLVVLPCKVGDAVYRPLYGKIWVGKVRYFSYDGDVIAASIQNENGGAFVFEHNEDFGKTVFLTREEAEKALEGMG